MSRAYILQVTIAIALTLFSAAALLANPRADLNRLRSLVADFQKLDLNGDLYVTRLELETIQGEEPSAGALNRSFAARDTNGDGEIDFREFVNDDNLFQRLFQSADANQDNAVNQSELFAWLRNFPDAPSREDVTTQFSFADRNGDGKISYEEFQAMLAGG